MQVELTEEELKVIVEALHDERQLFLTAKNGVNGKESKAFYQNKADNLIVIIRKLEAVKSCRR